MLGCDSRSPQRKTLKTLREQWERELLRVLQQTKATTACQAHEGQPTLYPFLCLLSEEEFVSMLMQVGRVWRPRAEEGRGPCSDGHSLSSCRSLAPGSAGAAGAG